MSRVGLVFQFPERHFLGQDVFGEITFAWPRDPAFFMQQQALRARVMKVGRATLRVGKAAIGVWLEVVPPAITAVLCSQPPSSHTDAT